MLQWVAMPCRVEWAPASRRPPPPKKGSTNAPVFCLILAGVNVPALCPFQFPSKKERGWLDISSQPLLAHLRQTIVTRAPRSAAPAASRPALMPPPITTTQRPASAADRRSTWPDVAMPAGRAGCGCWACSASCAASPPAGDRCSSPAASTRTQAGRTGWRGAAVYIAARARSTLPLARCTLQPAEHGGIAISSRQAQQGQREASCCLRCNTALSMLSIARKPTDPA